MTLPANRQAWARVGAWLWGLALLTVCLFPSKELPRMDVPFIDKWVHFVLFGGQTFLALAALKHPTRRNIGRVVLLCALFGAAIEVLQLLSNAWLHRAYEFADIVADAVGVLIGLLLFLLIKKLFFKKPGPIA